MILIVTNKTDYTADFVIVELKRRGIPFARFNTEDFPSAVDLTIRICQDEVAAVLHLPDKTIELNQIKSVWYRRPVSSNPSSQIEDVAARDFVIQESKAALEGFWRLLACIWVSHPDKLRVAESKIYQLKIAASLGFEIPGTMVTDSPEQAHTFYDTSSGPTIYKPLRHTRLVHGESVSLIYSTKLETITPEQFDSVRFAPVLLQPYVLKAVEVRVTVVGKQVFAAELHTQEVYEARHDWRRADIARIKHQPHRLPKELEQKCVSLVQVLGLQFGAIDLILTPEGKYIFLEINPNGQWAWIQQMCPEIKIREALIDVLTDCTQPHE